MALRRRSLALLWLACGAAAAQEQRAVPTFSSEVELITVDAVVLDAEGRPVPGLTRDDFAISEDGRPQEIASFEAFALEAAEPVEPSAVASNEPRATSGRAFGILLDDLAIAPPLAAEARKNAVAFVERSLRDGDEVVLGTTSGDVFWSTRLPEGREDLVAVLSRVKGRAPDAIGIDFMTDYEAFRIANYEDAPAVSDSGPGGQVTLEGRGTSSGTDTQPTGGLGGTATRVKKRWQDAMLCAGASCDGLVRGRAMELDAARRDRMRLTFRALHRQLDALALVHGRKSLLLFSSGFLQDSGPDLRELAAASREANTAVYFLDLRGLMAQTGAGALSDPRRLPEQTDQASMRFEQTSLAAAGSETLADDTGGFSVRNTNDLDAGARRIANESRVFYLLGFHPPEGRKGPGEWRKLRVEVKRAGLTVRARRGYTLRAASAPPARPDKKLAAAVERALDSAHEASGIPLRAMAYVFEPRAGATHVVVAIEFDAGRVSFVPKGGKRVAQLEVSVVALERDSGRGFSHEDRVDLAVEGNEPPGWRGLAREFELPPGVAQAHVVVRDPASGALGSVWQRFEVPAPGTLRLSTPILTDHLEPPAAPGARPQPALAVHRTFAPEGQLYCEFQVFGAERHGESAPRVSAGLELTKDGRVVRSADATPIGADADGRLVRLLGLGLDGMAEGDYELRLSVRDDASGERLDRVEAFTLARAR